MKLQEVMKPEGQWLGPHQIKTREKYMAKDASDQEGKSEMVIIKSKKKDGDTGFWDVEVELEDGTLDQWYLEDDDKIFY